MPKGRLRERRQARAPAASEALGLLGDDCFASRNLIFALLEIICRDGLEIVDVIEIDILHEIDFRLNIARHGNIDEQQWPIFSCAHEGLKSSAIQNVMRRGGAADNDINLVKLIRPLLEM